MQKRQRFIGFFAMFLVALALGHLFIQVAFFGTGIRGIAEKGISGLAVDDTQGTRFNLSLSTVILFAEWGLILLGFVFVYAKHKIDLRKEFEDLQNIKGRKQFRPGTELDNFYELLQEVKHFRLSSAAKVFRVDDEVIEDWAKTLESRKVAQLTYPRIGGPEIIFNKPAVENTSGAVKEKTEVKNGAI